MSWEVTPEPLNEDDRLALLRAVEQALAASEESAWWRSGFEELGSGPTPKEAWRGAGVIEP